MKPWNANGHYRRRQLNMIMAAVSGRARAHIEAIIFSRARA